MRCKRYAKEELYPSANGIKGKDATAATKRKRESVNATLVPRMNGYPSANDGKPFGVRNDRKVK